MSDIISSEEWSPLDRAKHAYRDSRVHLQMLAGVVPKGDLDRVEVILDCERLQPAHLVRFILVRYCLDCRWSDGSACFVRYPRSQQDSKAAKRYDKRSQLAYQTLSVIGYQRRSMCAVSIPKRNTRFYADHNVEAKFYHKSLLGLETLNGYHRCIVGDSKLPWCKCLKRLWRECRKWSWHWRVVHVRCALGEGSAWSRLLNTCVVVWLVGFILVLLLRLVRLVFHVATERWSCWVLVAVHGVRKKEKKERWWRSFSKRGQLKIKPVSCDEKKRLSTK